MDAVGLTTAPPGRARAALPEATVMCRSARTACKLEILELTLNIQFMNEEIESRPIIYIPDALRRDLPQQGSVLALGLRNDSIDPIVCIDSKGMIYGVLVHDSVDFRRNPINFCRDDIISVRVLTDVPANHHFV